VCGEERRGEERRGEERRGDRGGNKFFFRLVFLLRKECRSTVFYSGYSNVRQEPSH
jgi:hypothetical protein